MKFNLNLGNLRFIKRTKAIGQAYKEGIQFSKKTVESSEKLIAATFIVHAYIKGGLQIISKLGIDSFKTKKEVFNVKEDGKEYSKLKKEATLAVSSLNDPAVVRQYNQDCYGLLKDILLLLKKNNVTEFKIKYKMKKIIINVNDELKSLKKLVVK